MILLAVYLLLALALMILTAEPEAGGICRIIVVWVLISVGPAVLTFSALAIGGY